MSMDSAHSDHPMRHWDRTCPVCNPDADQQTAHSSQASAPSEGGGNTDTEVRIALSDGTVTSEDLPPARAKTLGHELDEDASCIHCGFDGAEWYHWRHHTYEGKAATGTEAKQPLCTRSEA